VVTVDVLPECWGTPHVKALGTWFYFSVAGAAKDDVLLLELRGMTSQRPLMAADPRVVVRLGTAGSWYRTRLPASFVVRAAFALPESPSFVVTTRHTRATAAAEHGGRRRTSASVHADLPTRGGGADHQPAVL